MKTAFADSPEFRKLLRGEPDPDLVRIALEIARDAYPGLDPEPYLARIEALAARVRDRSAAIDRPRLLLGQINWVLFVEEGYQGNTEHYHDPRNSYLNEVMDRKIGIPISLSLLYWRVAEKAGLSVGGVNLPAHFLLRVGEGEGMVFVDPFHSGQILDGNGCRRLVARLLGPEFAVTNDQLGACSVHEVVARMLRNLKAIHFQQQDYPSALPIQRRLAALQAGDPLEQRDLGLLYLRIDRPADAIDPLEAYLKMATDESETDHVRTLLKAARREMAMRN